jgi:hypothetical protein
MLTGIDEDKDFLDRGRRLFVDKYAKGYVSDLPMRVIGY